MVLLVRHQHSDSARPAENLDLQPEAYSLRVSVSVCRPRMHLILYQRDDCHLCDLALGVLALARVPDFTSVFIDDDPVLDARYGDRVPVLRDVDSTRELNWPFDTEAVAAWLAGVPR